MPFCPICREEYSKGITICSECNVSLVEGPAVETVSVFALQKEDAAQKFIDYMHEQGMEGSYEYSMRENAYKIYVEKPDMKKAVKLFASFYVMESRRKRGDSDEPEQSAYATKENNSEELTLSKESAEQSDSSSTLSSENEGVTTSEEETVIEDITSLEEIESSNDPYDAFAEVSSTDTATDDSVFAFSTESEQTVEPEEPSISSEPAKVEEISAPVIEESELARRPSGRLFKRLFGRHNEPLRPEQSPTYVAPAMVDDDEEEEPVSVTSTLFSAPVAEDTFVESTESANTPDNIPEVISEDTDSEASLENPVDDTFDTDFSFDSMAMAEASSTISESVDDFLAAYDAEHTEDADIASENIQIAATEIEAIESNALESDTTEIENDADAIVDDVIDFAEPDAVAVSETVFEVAVEEVFEEVSVEPKDVDSTEEISNDISEEISEDISEDPEDFNISEEISIEEAVDTIDSEYTLSPTEEFSEEVDISPEDIAITADDAVAIPAEYVPEPEEVLDHMEDVFSVTSPSEEPAEDDYNAFSDFIENFKNNASTRPGSVSDTTEDITLTTDEHEPVVEEILPDRSLYTRDTSDYESVSLRPTDIQDSKITVPVDYDIIEEVITDSIGSSGTDFSNTGSSSFADPSKAKDNNFRQPSHAAQNYGGKVAGLDDSYHGFVPDYSMNEEAPEEEEEVDQAYEDFKRRVKERKAEQDKLDALANKERVKKANLEKQLANGKKIIFEDTEDLDNYAGFVPDYTPNTNDEDEFSFYKPRTVSNYAKYKKGKKSIVPENLASAPKPCISSMRLTNGDEVHRLFVEQVPVGAKKIISPSEVRTSNFIVSMSGKQLTYLFNSWLLLNVTPATVKEFESPDASDEDNFEAKIEGIKNQLTETFGDLNESFMDNLVHKYYTKYLDD